MNVLPAPRRLILPALLAASLLAPVAAAHELRAPKPHAQPVAVWPADREASHDVIVPVVLVVSKDGSVVEASIETSVDAEIDEAALTAARAWRFDPALDGDRPVAAKVRGVIRFLATPRARAVAHRGATATGTPHDHSHGPQHKHPVDSPPPKPEVHVAGHGETAHEQRVQVTGERSGPRSASETVRDRAVLTAAPHRSAADLLRTVPGVHISQHGGDGKSYQIFFRGFDAQHGQDIELWAGGAPVNQVSNVHAQGYADLYFIPTELVKELRAQAGNYDPRQGDFAVAGSMHLTLGNDRPGVTAKLGVGSFGTRRMYLAYRPKEAQDSTFGAVEVYASDGFGPARAARRASALAQTTFELGDGTAVRVLASTYAGRFDSAGVLRRSDVDAGLIDRFATYDPKQGGDSTRSSLVADFASIGENSRWSFAPYLVFTTMRLRSNYTGYLSGTGTPEPEGASEQQLNSATTVGTRGSWNAPFPLLGSSARVEAGVSARADWIDQSQRRLSQVDDQVTNEQVDAKVNASDAAAYLDFSLRPLDRLTLHAGARLEGLFYSTEDNGGNAAGQARSAAGAQLAKRASAEFELTRGLAAVLSYGEGFRSPQARQLGNGQTAPFTTVVSYEAGLRYEQRRRLRASLAVFETRLSDDLAFDPLTAGVGKVPRTSRRGVSAEFTSSPGPNFVSSWSATYTRAAFTESGYGYEAGALLPYVPQLVARTDLAYKPRLAKLLNRSLDGRVGAGASTRLLRPLPYGEFGQDSFVVDLNAGVRLKEVELSLDVFNALDARWVDGEFVYASNFTSGSAGSLVPQRMVTVGAPRTALATLTLHL